MRAHEEDERRPRHHEHPGRNAARAQASRFGSGGFLGQCFGHNHARIVPQAGIITEEVAHTRIERGHTMTYLGEGTPKLGFGLMRLPNLEPGKPDIEQIKQMVDVFMERGFTYFDTARAYGTSEAAIKEALVDRYPRESYQLASKNAAWLMTPDEQTAKAHLQTSLETTGAGYFDYYLIHNLGSNRTQVFDKWNLWEWAVEQKEAGLIKHLGASFHDTADVVAGLLDAHPEIEFAQLQINWADWDDPFVQARQCFEACRERNIPVIIMEPIKGGTLATLPERVEAILREANPDKTPAEWALQYVASLPGVITVLSGMSTLEQTEQNTAFMSSIKPLTADEQAAMERAQEALRAMDLIPCTACNYCTKDCPMNIPIPDILAAMNRETIYEDHEKAAGDYRFGVMGKGKASDCIQCGQCEGACPQGISIMEHLEAAVAQFE